DEVGQGRVVRDFRQPRETLRRGLGRCQVWFDDLGRVGAGLRVVPQFEIGRDRFRVEVLQVHRIEVEGQKGQQRRGQDYDRQGDRDDRNTPTLQKAIDRRQTGEPHRA